MGKVTRIRIGQLVHIGGRAYRVAERQRGRVGEERVMYVLEAQDSTGAWRAAETRCRTTVLRALAGQS